MASKKKSPKIRTIQNAKGEWRWHIVSPNGKKVSCGGEQQKRQAGQEPIGEKFPAAVHSSGARPDRKLPGNCFLPQ